VQNQTPLSNTPPDFPYPMTKQMTEAREETKMDGGILERWVLFVVMGIIFAINLHSFFSRKSKL
jgi:hypothetical protein